MLQKDNRHKVLKVFFGDPVTGDGGFQLREICRMISLSPPSVMAYLGDLVKEGLVIEGRHRIHGYPTYRANRDGDYFRFLKRMDSMLAIKESGLLDHLDKTCMPDAIVLFGSAARGEDTKESDIDLFLLCSERKLDLTRYEKILKRRINPIFSSDFSKLSKELRNNIINGAILKGYLKVF